MKFSYPASRTAAVLVLAACFVHAAPSRGDSRAALETGKLVASVKSKDGTKIAYEQSGKGPALVLVSSALASRAGAVPLATLLEPSFTVINYDRRGRGGSGDSKAYAMQREIEDIEALVDMAGGSAFLFGSSSGAALALEAANALGGKVRALVAFEPPYIVDNSRPPIPADFSVRVSKLVSAGRRGDAVAEFMKECVGVPEESLGMMKRAPMWAGMEKLAHTLPYDLTILSGLQAGKTLPRKRWTALTARTLVIDGERSDVFLRNAVEALAEILPTSKRHTLKGQDHSVVFMAPESLVPVLVEFLVPQSVTPPRADADRSEADR